MKHRFKRCEYCGRKLKANDVYHQTYGTCDSWCYGVLVGIYFDDGKDANYMREDYIDIKFQEGAVDLNGVNGCQIEDVIDVLVERLQGFQQGSFPCRENALAITKLEEARLWLNERTRKRKEQGVEGKDEKHI